MEVFFADDSTVPSCSREGMGPLIGVGGVLIEELQLRPLTSAINNIAKTFGIPEQEEIKWSPHKSSWIYAHLHNPEREKCYSQILSAAHDHAVKAIVICNDMGRTAHSKDRAFQVCLDYLFERLSMNLESRNANALIVADRPGGEKIQEDEFLAYFLQRVQDGTEYVVPDRVLLNVLTTPSNMIRQLQLADLVTGITAAVVAGKDKYAGPLFPLVQRLFITNRPGGIAGTGLKIAPDSDKRSDSLVNLYHWILGENLLHKGGGAVAHRLPTENFPFMQDARVA